MPVHVTYKGPLFDGDPSRVVEQGLQEALDVLAGKALDLVRARLGQVLKHPTGRYRSKVMVDRARSTSSLVVTDGGVVYGPWLEGTSGRNQRSRFKGYRTFRQTTDDLRRAAAPTAEPVIARHVEKLNG